MIDPSSVQLGKKAGVVEDPRTLKLASVLIPEDLPAVRPRWRIAVKLHSWPMFANDRYGCCVFATHGHRVMSQEWSSGRRDKLPVSVEDVLAFYSEVTGFDRNRPETDNGAYLIDALRRLRTVGFGLEADGTAHTIAAYARVGDVGKTDEFRRAAHLFGGMMLGLALPTRAQSQSVWDDAGTATYVDQPYSWGGHSVDMIGYDATGVTLVTWGREQRATWRWVERYVDEAWVVVSEDFINRKGRTPQGLDVDRLTRYLGSL